MHDRINVVQVWRKNEIVIEISDLLKFKSIF